MSLNLPPRGSRGIEIPGALRPIFKAMSWTQDVMFKLGAKVQGRPLLRLTTIGAKTGKPRRVVLGWFPDGGRDDSWLVVASNAGSARHPGWAFNLAANPEQVIVEVGNETHAARAEVLTEEERSIAWEMVKEMSPGYGAYDTKTDRQIPILRLIATH
jgi:deazaflavin-dependent oxidoreductase (nitroreductase family)